MSVSNEREVNDMKITNEVMKVIEVYMDDDIRELVHYEIAPCTNDEFVARYCELDEDFEELIYMELGIEIL